MILATTHATWTVQMIMNRVELNAAYFLILQVNTTDILQRRKMGDSKVVYYIFLIFVIFNVFLFCSLVKLRHDEERH
jgi:hypothetical protein